MVQIFQYLIKIYFLSFNLDSTASSWPTINSLGGFLGASTSWVWRVLIISTGSDTVLFRVPDTPRRLSLFQKVLSRT